MGIFNYIGLTIIILIMIPNIVFALTNKDAINRERDFRKIHPKIPNNIENSLQMIA